MQLNEQHQPVLLKEVINYLKIKPDGIYIDATFGRGGHTREIVKHLGNTGRLIAIDRDPAAIAYAKKQWEHDPRVQIYQHAFSNIEEITKTLQIRGHVDGILLDLGVSSPQLDQPERGFSFLRDGPLDMRMDPNQGVSASQWLAYANETEMARVFREYGEERYAKRIAKAICEARYSVPITHTVQLADIIKQAHPRWERHKHPATQTFQAIRIWINEELHELQTCLKQILDILAVGGRFMVISFHSLEDRIVKHFIRKYSTEPTALKHVFAIPHTAWRPRVKNLVRAIKPDAYMVTDNPRSRSAILRIGEKIS